MIGASDTTCTAFAGTTRIASGPLSEVALIVRAAQARGGSEPLLIFDDLTSHPLEVDLRGTDQDVLSALGLFGVVGSPIVQGSTGSTSDTSSGDGAAKAAILAELPATIPDSIPAAARGPGRPRLGVVAREITLLPRHWEWLGKQTGGASVALRKLVDEAKRMNEARDRARTAQESAYRFMSAMAGNQPAFEEAMRAFFANNAERFEALVMEWPVDVREHSIVLASRAFGATRYKVV